MREDWDAAQVLRKNVLPIAKQLVAILESDAEAPKKPYTAAALEKMMNAHLSFHNDPWGRGDIEAAAANALPEEALWVAQQLLIILERDERRLELKALIPAIMKIERGYYENVCYFIAKANEGLEQAGSTYRFASTAKMVNVGELGEGEYVDTVTVVEAEEG
jgi:hypothetical protein